MTTPARPLWIPPGYQTKPTLESDFDAVPFPATTAATPQSPAVKHVIRVGSVWLVAVKLVDGRASPILGKRPDAIRYPSKESAQKAAQCLGRSVFELEPAAK